MKRRDLFKGLAAGLGTLAACDPVRDGDALAAEGTSPKGRTPRFIDIHVHTCKPRHPKVTRQTEATIPLRRSSSR